MSVVAGLTLTKERSEVMSFPFVSLRNVGAAFVRRPRADDISMQAYLSEFTKEVWISLLFFFILITAVMYVILHDDLLFKTKANEIDFLSTKEGSHLESFMRAINVTFK